MASGSPIHVYSIECAMKISSINTKMAPCTTKSAKVTVGRDSRRRILIEIEMKSPRPATISYLLTDCVVHMNTISTGKATIELPERNLYLQMSNCAPRQLNIFLKSLKAKLDLLNAEKNGQKTPISVARSLLTQGLPQVFNKLSPLTIPEIRKVQKLRGVPIENKENSKDNISPKKPGNAQGTTPKRPAGARATGLRRSLPLSTPLSAEQRAIVRRAVDDRQSVFFTGSAGTGKSFVLHRIIESLPAQTTVVTAATGVAACQIGGVTLHSFAGFGLVDTAQAAMAILEQKKATAKQWRDVTHLIIDEISMVHMQFFSLLEEVARLIRRSDEPFGGIQLVLTGDFFQLPPVGREVRFCFESEAWRRSVTQTMILREVRRQEDDQLFVDLLQQIREGRCDPLIEKTLRSTRKNEVGGGNIVLTRLCTHNADADCINEKSLNSLPGEEKVFISQDTTYIPDSLSSVVPSVVRLKANAQVMLTRNMDLSRGLSNGARGTVTSFSPQGWPLVQFVATKEPIEIRPAPFNVRIRADESAVRLQIPLQIAWAISIHKSQGLTLDAVQVSLGRAFAEGQAYVALSRARSLSTLKVLDFDAASVKANDKVIAFYNSIERENHDEDYDDVVITKRRRTR